MSRVTRFILRFTIIPAVLWAAASCSASSSEEASGGTGTSTGTGSGAGGGSASASGAGQGGDFIIDGGSPDGQPSGGGACDPPDMMITLDRTLTMHFTPEGVNPTDAPGYASSKWHQAITAIEKLASPPMDQSIRFGLELWPRESEGCITLAERIEDTKQATNASCEDGEVLVEPSLASGAKIQGSLDPATTKICLSTPTGKALLTGSDYLASHAVPGRGQYILLVTDGADWDQSCPDPNPLAVTQKLAAAGINTFVVGFFATGSGGPSGVGVSFLNDMACAGHTAKGFPGTCKAMGDGYVAADPGGPTLYLAAGDGNELSVALQGIAAEVCCDCPK